ncbi:DUF5908 family protein [Aquimarina sp. D1M17]|uniref:DUF5908 family protein n=1 Tax=Aquimarina acroporae TaxID=2937283 RepID=UPI0020BF780D|nr:DUF5908 family protein [Aquimarina acroporae]MCK8521014.1 DUF5908 family protein [Aquimarina acroporae]
MAVEIKEIVIRAIVSDASQTNEMDQSTDMRKEQQEIVQECVHHVLKILKKKNLR